MKFHDFRLDSYQVLVLGETIKLHLVYDYAGTETDESHITFNGVALHHFINTQGTIITDIEEVPLAGLLNSMESDLTEWNRLYGVKYWELDFASYISKLHGMGFKSWEVTSAIGFYGFIVAKGVSSA